MLGFSGDEAPTVVRLSGDVNGTAFWRQPAVIEELRVQLSRTLNDGRTVDVPVVAVKEEKRVKRGLFGRKGKGGKEEREGEGEGGEDFGGGQMGVRAGMEEICLRTTNEFGLYDTLNRMCVVVRVEARC